MKRIVVLGSTGSIGTQTLDIVKQHPEILEVVGLVANRSVGVLKQQQAEFPLAKLALMDTSVANELGIPGGMDAIVSMVTDEAVDLVVVAVAGVIGLVPTIAAIEAGKQIALASKEVLVAAGEFIMPLVKKHGTLMTPIDSEHSAIFQCMQGYKSEDVDSLILTASGGPFRGWTTDQLASVTKEQALNHPTWKMGGKITIDSATLMNKGLEVIEAKWLFGLDIGQVKVVVHPQSIVHSFVQFKDTSVLGQCGWPDMRLPIQYALLYPERRENRMKPWNPVETPNLTFEPLDHSIFRGPSIAIHASKLGGTAPCAMNAANEEATAQFLRGNCAFLEIYNVIERTLEAHQPISPSLENLLAIDRWARETVRALLKLELA